MVAGLPNVLDYVCLVRRYILQFLNSIPSSSKQMSLCARSLTGARRSTQVLVTEGSCQSFGLLSGWSDRLSGTEALQPPTQDGGVRLRLPACVSFHS